MLHRVILTAATFLLAHFLLQDPATTDFGILLFVLGGVLTAQTYTTFTTTDGDRA